MLMFLSAGLPVAGNLQFNHDCFSLAAFPLRIPARRSPGGAVVDGFSLPLVPSIPPCAVPPSVPTDIPRSSTMGHGSGCTFCSPKSPDTNNRGRVPLLPRASTPGGYKGWSRPLLWVSEFDFPFVFIMLQPKRLRIVCALLAVPTTFSSYFIRL